MSKDKRRRTKDGPDALLLPFPEFSGGFEVRVDAQAEQQHQADQNGGLRHGWIFKVNLW